MASQFQADLPDRKEARDEVHHRARAVWPDGRDIPVVIVNISPGGLMARCELPIATDDMVIFTLPMLGKVQATVRWALGGRLGCKFDRPIGESLYYPFLAKLNR